MTQKKPGRRPWKPLFDPLPAKPVPPIKKGIEPRMERTALLEARLTRWGEARDVITVVLLALILLAIIVLGTIIAVKI